MNEADYQIWLHLQPTYRAYLEKSEDPELLRDQCYLAWRTEQILAGNLAYYNYAQEFRAAFPPPPPEPPPPPPRLPDPADLLRYRRPPGVEPRMVRLRDWPAPPGDEARVRARPLVPWLGLAEDRDKEPPCGPLSLWDPSNAKRFKPCPNQPP